MKIFFEKLEQKLLLSSDSPLNSTEPFVENLESVPAGTSEVSPVIAVSSAITVADALNQWQALFPGQDYVVWEKDAPWDHLDRVASPPVGVTELQNISLDIGRNEYESTSFVITNIFDAGPITFDLSSNASVVSTTLRKGIWVTELDGSEINDALSLIDGNQVSIAPGESLEIWVTLYGNDAAAGLYNPTIDILPQGLAPGSVNLSVTVHDISLPDVLPLNTAYWDYVVPGWDTPQMIDAKLADLKSHYVNTATVHPYIVPRYGFDNISGELIADYALFDDAIDTYEAGLAPESYLFEMLTDIYFESTGLIDYPTASRPTFLSPAWKDGFRDWLTGWVAHMQTLGMGYDDYVLHPYDERLDSSVIAIAQLIKQTDPQVRVLVNSLGSVADMEAIAPYVDVWDPYFYHYWGGHPNGYPQDRINWLKAELFPESAGLLFPSGDMENGGNATTPPLNWTSRGTDPGEGTVGVSSDTPTGFGQSLRVEGWNLPGYDYHTYSFDYSTGGDYGGKEFTVSYDYKGDAYTALWDDSGVTHAEWIQTDTWTHVERTFTAAPGTTVFSFYLYDNSPTGRAAYLDNVEITEVASTGNLFGNGNLESGGTATTPPTDWSEHGNGPGEGTIGVSSDTPTSTGQSLRVEGWNLPGYDYNTYSHTYSAQNGFAAGDYTLSYDVKGDFYTNLDSQNGTLDVGHSIHWTSDSNPDANGWTHIDTTVTVGAGGVDGFSFYLYDHTPTSNAAYLDNLSLVPTSPAEPPGEPPLFWTYTNPSPSITGIPPATADAYQYYRSVAWHGWNKGMTGLGNWIYSYRDAWNYFGVPGVEEGGYAMVYDATRLDTPPEVSSQELIVPSKRWEATREGVEDYTYLSMLRSAIDNSSLPPGSSLIVDAENTLATWVQTVVDNQDTDFAAQAKPDIINAIIALTPVRTPGDFNDDDNVDGVDLAIWQDNYGTTVGASPSDGDDDEDGDVDGFDFLSWQRNHGTGVVSATAISSATTVEDALSQWQALFPGQDYVVWEKDAPWDHLDRVTGPPAGVTEVQNISLDIGRNEYESSSFVITSLVNIGGGSTVFDLSYVPNAISTTLRKGIWITSRDGTEVNDALSLIDGNQVSIAQGESLEIWVTLDGNDAAAGQYNQTINIVPQGLAPGSVDLSVTVHDVSLPDVLPLNTFYWDYIVPGWSTPELNAAKLADLKSHYVNTATVHPYSVPRYGFDNISGALVADYALFDDAIDTYEAGLAPETYVFEMLTSIYFESTTLIDYPTASRPAFLSTAWKAGFQQWLTGWVSHMQARGMGYDDYYISPYDERLDASVYEIAKLIKETDPQVRVHTNALGTVQEIDNIAPYVDVWTPLLNSWLAIGGVTGAMSQTVSLSPNTQYAFSFYGKNGTSTMYWDMNFNGSTSRRAEILGATDWVQDTHNFTTASDTTQVTFNFYPTVGNGSIFIDDVVLVGSGPNLVINGDIEQGTASPPTGWSTPSATAVVSTTDPNSGSQSAQVTSIPQETNPGKDAIQALVFPDPGTGTGTGANLFTNGDLENGGDATTPPLNWTSRGTDPGEGTVGVSSDTPTGFGQSLRVEGWNLPGYNYHTYSFDYSTGGDYGGKEFTVSYDYKGDAYTTLWDDSSVTHAEWIQTDTWTHVEHTFTAAPGTTVFSFYLYDNSPTGRAAYVDNITLTPASQPEPPSQSYSLWTYANPQGTLPSQADPYRYYRSAIWQAWNEGMTGFGYWIYSGRGAWNYFGVPGVTEGGYAVVYDSTRLDTPPEVSSQELIVPSKRWEATREGVEDYTYLWMLRSAIDNSSLPPGSSLIVDAENTLATWVQTVVDNQDTDFAAQAKPDIINAIIALTPVRTPGNFNNDDIVDGNDLDIWQDNYGTTSGASPSVGDDDEDGDVDGADFLNWQRNHGTVAGTATASSAAANANLSKTGGTILDATYPLVDADVNRNVTAGDLFDSGDLSTFTRLISRPTSAIRSASTLATASSSVAELAKDLLAVDAHFANDDAALLHVDLSSRPTGKDLDLLAATVPDDTTSDEDDAWDEAWDNALLDVLEDALA